MQLTDYTQVLCDYTLHQVSCFHCLANHATASRTGMGILQSRRFHGGNLHSSLQGLMSVLRGSVEAIDRGSVHRLYLERMALLQASASSNKISGFIWGHAGRLRYA